jgi:Fe2+ transport system protein FeoA
MKRRAPPAARVLRALDELRPGESSVILSVDGDPQVARRLMELVRRAPLGDPVELRVRRTHLSIRRSEAELVYVESH